MNLLKKAGIMLHHYFNNHKYILIACIALIYILSGCISAFEPVGLKDRAGLLVVEGVILEEGTRITLSRTVRLDEDASGRSADVNNATIHIIDEAYNAVAVAEQSGHGQYIVNDKFSFVPGMKYALDIRLGGSHYQSAFIEPVPAPAIDSVSWILNDDNSIDIRVSTHDPANESLYCLWDFEENWELRATYFAPVRFDPLTLSVIPQSYTGDNRYYCWASARSGSLLMATTEKFRDAVIKDHKIHTLRPGNHRYSYLYSINVRQYRLSREDFAYFNNLKKNVEESGSLFAPQPTEIKGNIRCLSDPDETVIGHILVSKAATSRLFIPMAELRLNHLEGLPDCSDMGQQFSAPFDAYYSGYGIWGGGGGSYIYILRRCVDCTQRIGPGSPSKIKPDFWPNDHR